MPRCQPRLSGSRARSFRDGSGPVLALDHDDVWGTGVVDGGDDVDAASGQRQCPLISTSKPHSCRIRATWVSTACHVAGLASSISGDMDWTLGRAPEQAAYLFRLRRDSISGPSAKRRHQDGRSNSSGADDPLSVATSSAAEPPEARTLSTSIVGTIDTTTPRLGSALRIRRPSAATALLESRLRLNTRCACEGRRRALNCHPCLRARNRCSGCRQRRCPLSRSGGGQPEGVQRRLESPSRGGDGHSGLVSEISLPHGRVLGGPRCQQLILVMRRRSPNTRDRCFSCRNCAASSPGYTCLACSRRQEA